MYRVKGLYYKSVDTEIEVNSIKNLIGNSPCDTYNSAGITIIGQFYENLHWDVGINPLNS